LLYNSFLKIYEGTSSNALIQCNVDTRWSMSVWQSPIHCASIGGFEGGRGHPQFTIIYNAFVKLKISHPNGWIFSYFGGGAPFLGCLLLFFSKFLDPPLASYLIPPIQQKLHTRFHLNILPVQTTSHFSIMHFKYLLNNTND
jgi:hypothetical protein